MFFYTPRSVYGGVADCGNDRHNHADIGRGAQGLRDCDERVEAGISECVSDPLCVNHR